MSRKQEINIEAIEDIDSIGYRKNQGKCKFKITVKGSCNKKPSPAGEGGIDEPRASQ